MHRVSAQEQAITAPISPPTSFASPLLTVSTKALSYIRTKIGAQAATAVFIVFSLGFGFAIVFIVPPLRGPDEIAHFLRVLSYTRGEVLPSAELNGRKGIMVERKLYNELQFFKSAGEWFATAREQGLRYGQIMPLYQHVSMPVEEESNDDVVFAAFAGTEGYNPVAYAPYVLAGVIGFKLDFPHLLLLMRMLGLVTFTVVVAYAIAVTPVLKWAFVLIALLPVSLYNRSILSADGAALSSALMITALCLRAASGRTVQPWQRSLWMTLCALSKQPQIIFVLLEFMVYPLKDLSRRWRSIAVVVLPCLVLSPVWVTAVSAEIAAWRLQLEERHPPEHFNPLWKLFYMWEHPLHFPLAAWKALSGWWHRLWQELIGILGWQDILLQSWIYVLLTLCLLLIPLETLHLDSRTRVRVLLITGASVLAYVAFVYLIFFLTYTPLDTDHVRGVQGRYFVVVLPVAAIFVATVANLEMPRGLTASLATVATMVSGVATVEALFHSHW